MSDVPPNAQLAITAQQAQCAFCVASRPVTLALFRVPFAAPDLHRLREARRIYTWRYTASLIHTITFHKLQPASERIPAPEKYHDPVGGTRTPTGCDHCRACSRAQVASMHAATHDLNVNEMPTHFARD
eukprot:2947688-Pleurochrysis_carterae.AAC.6